MSGGRPGRLTPHHVLDERFECGSIRVVESPTVEKHGGRSVDIELAAARDIGREQGVVLGTLRYLPPEAFESRTDARSDIYSLGLTLYELLTLEPA